MGKLSRELLNYAPIRWLKYAWDLVVSYYLIIKEKIMSGIDGGTTTPPPPTAAPQYALNATFNGKSVVVGANARFGGAIYSMKMDDFEYLDSSDHGRELQTAWQLNGQGEANNPTEAGSAANGAGSTSSTIILAAAVAGTTLTTRVRPAFWYPYQGQVTSDDSLEKTVTLGHNGRNNILVHDIGMYLSSPYNSSMAVEGLTAYMPLAFTRFFLLDRATKATTEILPSGLVSSASLAVMAATADLSKAVALVHPNPQHIYWIGKIGPWPKLDAAWFGANNPAGWYRWRAYTVFGLWQDVLDSAQTL